MDLSLCIQPAVSLRQATSIQRLKVAKVGSKAQPQDLLAGVQVLVNLATGTFASERAAVGGGCVYKGAACSVSIWMFC